jgi:hypothetical protein
MNLNLILSIFLWLLGIEDISEGEDNRINGDEIIDKKPYKEELDY